MVNSKEIVNLKEIVPKIGRYLNDKYPELEVEFSINNDRMTVRDKEQPIVKAMATFISGKEFIVYSLSMMTLGSVERNEKIVRIISAIMDVQNNKWESKE